jgi:valyl-tRNA synthetase
MTKAELENKILAKRLPGLIALAAKLDNQILQAQLDGKDPGALQEKAAKLRLELHRFCDATSEPEQELQKQPEQELQKQPEQELQEQPEQELQEQPEQEIQEIQEQPERKLQEEQPKQEPEIQDLRATLQRFEQLARHNEQTILRLQAERDGLLSKLKRVTSSPENEEDLLDPPEALRILEIWSTRPPVEERAVEAIRRQLEKSLLPSMSDAAKGNHAR